MGPDANDQKLPKIPGQMSIDMFLTREEEEFLKVDAQLTTEAREEHGILNSDGIEIMKEELKRDRAQTLSLVEPSGKPWGSATLVPPSTFPTLSSTATAPSGASSSTSASASNSTTTGTPTSSAQFPSLSGYSSCANCTSVVDVNCFCISTNFTQSLTGCIAQGCPAELSSAEALAQQFCNIASSKPSLSFSITSIPSSSSSSSSTVPATTTTPTTTSSVPTTSTSTSTSSAATDGLRSLYGTIMAVLGIGLAMHVME
ncbi:uncharacterized protein LACBIDRAFT_294490 [Laccaria bicolor S238N-H82]|uniref:Predicted protein n=1 Tax=Laccaria bicolor (strain S238N-H82 / ATCC MYA-4686) TaxID=486041 RepID=B0DCH0_LACBS|nr:uncharacterized protein LACBIDRAFT_294490 [Laccaria bicolor S238N-H82]EDR07896.1 predicted protein [Laccaria bicolor S238N-H82]|eukprot:XP_001881685.1 predicted protein [Laccaria bicolor S238N-H82]